MKKVLFPILAMVLALGLALPMAAVVGAASVNDSVQSDTIYGITNTGSIHEVDPISGTGTEVATVNACPTGGSGPNGLAFDQDSHRIFYTNYPATTTNLYYIDLDDVSLTEVLVGGLEGEIACADFYSGNYYYIAGGTSQGFTDNLYEVAINPDGTMGTVTKYEDISIPDNHSYGFWGDIAIQDGIIYGFGDCKSSGHDYEFFQVNCDGTGFDVIAETSYGYQLAFGLDGTLYGHNYSSSNFYTIAWTDTSVTPTLISDGAHNYTDLASGMTSFANPSIEIDKSTPERAYFNGTVVTYSYAVHNDGDVPLENVSVIDDLAGSAAPVMDGGYNAGDNNDNDLLDPSETWQFTADYTLTCPPENYWSSVVVNTATATGWYEGEPVSDEDTWKLIVFQWQPRTIGYWGNWDNHYTDTGFGELFRELETNSPNLWDYFGGDYENVHDLLLGKPPKFKGEPVAKAEFLMEKQFLATWLNVKAYWDWTGEITLNEFPASADVGMDPNATVYLTGDAEVDLFGSTPTVMDILTIIENGKGTWTAEQLATAQIVLDKLNNAEDNSYGKFIPKPTGVLNLHEKNSDTWEIVEDGAWGALFYNLSGKEFQYLFYGYDLDDIEYSLIYYADFEDRMNVWGGNNPGALIATGTASGGDLVMSGSIDLGMDLPSPPDKNIDLHDYSGAPDYYANAHGAKIWLVPSSDYNGTDTVTNWNPDDFLFETDLIWYTDTDD